MYNIHEIQDQSLRQIFAVPDQRSQRRKLVRRQGLADEIVLPVPVCVRRHSLRSIAHSMRVAYSRGVPIEDGRDPNESADSSSSSPSSSGESTDGRLGNLAIRECIADRYRCDIVLSRKSNQRGYKRDKAPCYSATVSYECLLQ